MSYSKWAVALGLALGAASLHARPPQPGPTATKTDPDVPTKAAIEAEMKSFWERPRTKTEAPTSLHVHSVEVGRPRAIKTEDRRDRPGLPAEGKVTDCLIEFTLKTYEDDRTRLDKRTREALVYRDQFGKWRVELGAVRGRDVTTYEAPQTPPAPGKADPGVAPKADPVPGKGTPAAAKFAAPKLSYGMHEWDVAALEKAFVIHKCFQNDKAIPEVEFLLELRADSTRAEATKWTMVLKDADGIDVLTGYLSFSPSDWRQGDKMRATFSRGVENAYKEQWQKATKVVIKHE